MRWAEVEQRGYGAPIWMTFTQAKELCEHNRKGNQGGLVVDANTLHKTEIDGDPGEELETGIPFMTSYTVFNVEQIEDFPKQYYATAELPKQSVACRIEHAERFFANTKAEIHHSRNRAYYAIQADYIQMPPFEFFKEPERYYATLGPETVHWSRHPSRLNRNSRRKRWGNVRLRDGRARGRNW